MAKGFSRWKGRKGLVFGAIGLAAIGPLLALVVLAISVSRARAQGHWAAVNRGRAFLEAGQPGRALQAVMQIKDAAPGAGEAMTVAGLSLLRLHQLKSAMAALERAVKLQPNQLDATETLADVYIMVGNLSRGAEVLEAAARLDPKDVRIWQAMSHAYEDLGKPAEAARALEQVLRLSPGDRESRARLIADLLESDEAARATPWVDQALADEPENPHLLGLAARHARDVGKSDAAGRYAARALKHDAANLNALLVRAGGQLSAGHAEAAVADLEQAFQTDPNHLEALQLLAQAETKLGLKDRAAATVERYRRAKERDELVKRLIQEIALRRADAEPRCFVANAALEAGQPALAARYYEAALALDPNYRLAQEGLKKLQTAKAPPLVSAPSPMPVPAGTAGPPAARR